MSALYAFFIEFVMRDEKDGYCVLFAYLFFHTGSLVEMLVLNQGKYNFDKIILKAYIT